MNKTELGLIILMTLTSSNLFGQFEIGIKGGLNISNIRNTDMPFYLPDNIYPVIGGHAGLYTQLDFTDKFHLNSDILFTTRGFKIEWNFARTTIFYLEIPVLLSYSITEKLEFELGPDIGFNLQKNIDAINDYAQNTSYESLDLGITSGLRYKLNDTISLTGRYYHGLTSIAAFFASRSHESKSFNRVIQFSVGYKLK